MNDSATCITGHYGSALVPVLRRCWRCAPKQAYRRTYDLNPGQSWFDAGTTDEQGEHYVLDNDGHAVPVGVMVARELKADGASEAAMVELWGGAVVVDERPVCVGRRVDGRIECASSHVETESILSRVLEECDGSLGGFPDVVAVYPDGRIALREVKRAGKDKVQANQDTMADILRELFGKKADLALVEWECER
jgi:hypothetical protein